MVRFNKGAPKLSPIVSEFGSTEEAEAYDVWFRAKVQAAINCDEPDIPHDEAMAEMRALIDSKSDASRLAG
ncbi:type II toxin-antitoxin system RelB family antitoxin [Sphingomonas sp. PB4P5]|uniref:type II toxin-antitoxin system RelB family antitoxin n=1 Tax=Parasphingomonas puruogangriensis TaxID=3096155 RepID=UPI003FA70B7A